MKMEVNMFLTLAIVLFHSNIENQHMFCVLDLKESLLF